MNFPALSIAPDRADQQVEDGWQVARQNDFSGGENQDENTCAPNEFLVAENCLVNTSGYLSKNYALNKLFTTTVTDNFTSITYNPTTNRVYAYNATTKAIWHHVGLVPAVDTIWTKSIAGLAPDDILAIVHYDAKTLFAVKIGGVVKLFYTDDGGASTEILDTLGASLDFVALAIYKNMVWAVDTLGNLRYSAIGNCTSWDPLDIILVGERIAYLYPKPGGMSLFCATYIRTLYGASRFDYAIELTSELRIGFYNTIDTFAGYAAEGFAINQGGLFKAELTGVTNLTKAKQDSYFKALGTVHEQSCGCYDYTNDRAVFSAESTKLIAVSSNGAIFKETVSGVTSLATTTLSYTGNSTHCYLMTAKVGADSYNSPVIVRTDTMDATRQFKIQTAHSDFKTLRDKVFNCFILTTSEAHTSVTVKYYLDRGSAVTFHSGTLAAGDNLLFLHDANGNQPRGKTISIEITTTEAIVIREMGVKFCTIGGDLG